MKYFLCVMTAACVLGALVSCKAQDEKHSGNKREREIIVGFSQIGAESAWRNGHTRSVQEAAAAMGVQLLFSNAEQKQENQIKAIRSFIAYQVDVIAFVPIVSSGWDNVLQEAKDAKIPVLVADRKIDIQDESLYEGFIGTDSIQEGTEAAKYLLKKYEEALDTAAVTEKNPVRIVELVGTVGSSAALGRAEGFRQHLAEWPQFRIIHSESGDFLRSKGYEVMKAVLNDYRDIDVVFSHNDGMTLGAIEAMRERDIEPGKDIIIITVDAEQAAIDALRRGEVNCVIECNPKQGPAIIGMAMRLALGRSIPRSLYVNEMVFTEWDDLTGLKPRGY